MFGDLFGRNFMMPGAASSPVLGLLAGMFGYMLES